MANTYTQIYIHVVFAVSGRENVIHSSWRSRLFQYITAIIQGKGHKVIAINGVSDHVHVFIGLNPNESLSKLISEVKSNSSRLINEQRLVRGKFTWQRGYGAFSYSRSQLSEVARYIENQEKHHSKRTFREEYIELLRRFEVEFDERYVFE